jgi:mRNA interferase MazF
VVTGAGYVPESGDIVWLDFDPQTGNEHAKRRPALVLSPASYNGKVGLMVCCPLTSKIKGYPFEVRIAGLEIPSVVLADQVKSMDWRARHAVYNTKATASELQHVLKLVAAFLQLR